MAAPDRGDLVWLDVDPQAGHEQAGRRPALVLSPRRYHQLTPFAIVCPVTTRAKGYGFEVPLPDGLPVSGVALADQVKSVDRRIRRIEPIARAPREFVDQVLARVHTLLNFEN